MKLVKQTSFYTTFNKAKQTTVIHPTHKMQVVQYHTHLSKHYTV